MLWYPWKKIFKTIFFQVLQNIDKFFKETGVYIPYIFIGKDYIHQGSIFLIFSWIRITRNRGVYWVIFIVISMVRIMCNRSVQYILYILIVYIGEDYMQLVFSMLWISVYFKYFWLFLITVIITYNRVSFLFIFIMSTTSWNSTETYK